MKRRTQKITGFLLAVQAAALLLTGCGAGDNTSASPRCLPIPALWAAPPRKRRLRLTSRFR